MHSNNDNEEGSEALRQDKLRARKNMEGRFTKKNNTTSLT